jgi:hypothetical protein
MVLPSVSILHAIRLVRPVRPLNVRFLLTIIAGIIVLQATLWCASTYGGEVRVINPGFEKDENVDDVPDGWQAYGRPLYDTTLLNSHSGARCVKVNIGDDYGQQLTITSGLHYTCGVWGESDNPWWGAGSLGALWFNNGTVVDFSHETYAVWPYYFLRFASLLAPLNATNATFLPTSASGESWIWVDDFMLYDEFLYNPDFETSANGQPDNWLAIQSPVYDSSGLNAHSGRSAVWVNADQYFYQDVAVAPGKTYCLHFWARCDTGIHEEALRIAWFDRSVEWLGTTELNFVTELDYAPYTVSFHPPEGAVLGRLMLQTSSQYGLWLDDVHIFWHLVTPSTFSPNNDQVFDTVRIIYALNTPVRVTLSISHATMGHVRTLVLDNEQAAGVHVALWTGEDDYGEPVPDGTYGYELLLSVPDLGDVTISGSIILDTSTSYPQPSHPRYSFLPRGAWVYSGGPFADMNYDETFSTLGSYGFNTAMLNWIPDERFTDALEAAERWGIRIILHATALNTAIDNGVEYATLDETSVRETIRSLRTTVGNYDTLLGYYVKDEPTPKYADNVRIVNQMLALEDPEHPGFSAFARTDYLAALMNTIDPAVCLFDYYPLSIYAEVHPNLLRTYSASVDETAQLAAANGIPLWMIVQGCGITRDLRVPTPEELRCMALIALAHGAKGIFYFGYQTSGVIKGLLTLDNEATARMQEAARLNEEISQLEPVLLDLTRIENRASVNVPHIVQTHVDSAGNLYIFLVNTDCLHRTFAQVTVAQRGIVHVRDVLQNQLIPFRATDSGIMFDYELAPGDGRLIALE